MENKPLPVTVDFNLSLDEMIQAGNYFYVNLKASEISQPKHDHDGVKKVEIQFVEFDKNMELQSMLDKFEQRGLRPASLPEFLALGAQHPHLQDEYVITTLDAVEKRSFFHFNTAMDIGEDRLIPCLMKLEGNRILCWAAFDGEYRPGFLFACVRKS